MRTAAILPVKRFAAAKQRLSSTLSDGTRAELAQAMVEDVLGALSACRQIEQTILVSAEPRAAAAARRLGAYVIEDGVEQGQSAAVAQGIAHARANGIHRVLCVPGDCPALEADELEALLAEDARAAGAKRVTIVPDRHFSGTNALLLRPPQAIEPSFGPESLERHRRLAQAAGCPVKIAEPRSLLLDIDTGGDLRELIGRLPTLPAKSRTRRLLQAPRQPAAAAAEGL